MPTVARWGTRRHGGGRRLGTEPPRRAENRCDEEREEPAAAAGDVGGLEGDSANAYTERGGEDTHGALVCITREQLAQLARGLGRRDGGEQHRQSAAIAEAAPEVGRAERSGHEALRRVGVEETAELRVEPAQQQRLCRACGGATQGLVDHHIC